MQDKTIQLKDGRRLGYVEHGDLSGKPVFFVHGNPGSRLMRHPDNSIAERLGVRMIAPDRPGYGLSDFQPGRTLLDFPNDLAQLADQLNINRFWMFGVSAGGPYVAATCYQLPERVQAAAIVSGAAPINRPGGMEGMNERFQTVFKLSQRAPEIILRWLIATQTRSALKNPAKRQQARMERASAADRELFQNPEIVKQIEGYYVESSRQGTKGMAREAKILVSDWGFPLAQVKPTVHLWYWEDDTTVPVQMGRYLESQLPNTVPHFLPGGGHFSVLSHWGEILEALVKA